MYQNKFVCAIKVGGRILREDGGTVYVPFGSEYSIYLRNLNAVRAKFKLQVDGKDATSDSWIVIPPNSAVDMERFIMNGDWNSGHRFKFIERTAEIEAHRGIGGEDGLVRVEFQVEQQKVPVPKFEPYPVPYPVPDPYYYPHWPYRPWGPFLGGQHTNSGPLRSRRMASPGGLTGQSVGSSSGDFYEGGETTASFNAVDSGANAVADAGEMPMAMPMGGGAAAAAAPATSDVGITVMGSVSNQRFVTVPDFACGPSDVMILQLRGEIAGRAVNAPVTGYSARTRSAQVLAREEQRDKDLPSASDLIGILAGGDTPQEPPRNMLTIDADTIKEILTSRFGQGDPGSGLSMDCHEAHALMALLHKPEARESRSAPPLVQELETAARRCAYDAGQGVTSATIAEWTVLEGLLRRAAEALR